MTDEQEAQRAEDRRQRLKGLVALEVTAAVGLAAFIGRENRDDQGACRRDLMSLVSEMFDEAWEGLAHG